MSHSATVSSNPSGEFSPISKQIHALGITKASPFNTFRLGHTPTLTRDDGTMVAHDRPSLIRKGEGYAVMLYHFAYVVCSVMHPICERYRGAEEQ